MSQLKQCIVLLTAVLFVCLIFLAPAPIESRQGAAVRSSGEADQQTATPAGKEAQGQQDEAAQATEGDTPASGDAAGNDSSANEPSAEQGQEGGALSGNLLQGRSVFVEKGCVKCHSVWGVGGKLGPDLTRVGMGRSYLQMAGLLWGHSPKMVELMEERGIKRPTFTPEDMRSLFSYLYYLNYFSGTGDAVAGRKSFVEKGCVKCHKVGDAGKPGGYALDVYRQYASPLYLAQEMWNHGPRMAAMMKAAGAGDTSLQGKEIADLAAFISGQAYGDAAGPKFMKPGNPAAGESLFAGKGCVKCHSIYDRGGKVGPDLSRRDLFKSANEIAAAMWSHGPVMWSKMAQTGIQQPKFKDNEMADVIAFLYFVRYTDRSGDPATGERLFAQKGCAECHSLTGGESIGPNLAASHKLVSPFSITSAMWNHADVMEKFVQLKRMSWPRFEGQEMRDLIEYLRSVNVLTAGRSGK